MSCAVDSRDPFSNGKCLLEPPKYPEVLHHEEGLMLKAISTKGEITAAFIYLFKELM